MMRGMHAHRAGVPWLLLLAACSAPPPPAAPPPAASAPPGPPPTFALAFVYEPAFGLKALRNGQPFEGKASLAPEGAGKPPPVDSGGTEGLPEFNPVDIEFKGGFAEIPQEKLGVLSPHRSLELATGEQKVLVPVSGGASPFACQSSIQTLEMTVACESVAPSPDTQISHCDTAGQRAWDRARDGLAERIEQCWARPDDQTLARLNRMPQSPASLYGCQRVLAALGKDPPVETSMKIWPRCADHFSPAHRQKVDDAVAMRDLPQNLALAKKSNSSDKMREFYLRYRHLAPGQAEEVRAFAARSFGPADQARWFALRRTIESLQGAGQWKATLCDLSESYVDVAIRLYSAPRYAQLDPYPATSPRSNQMGFAFDGYAARQRPRSDPNRQKFESTLNTLLKATTKRTVRVFSGSCPTGRHWYFAEAKGP